MNKARLAQIIADMETAMSRELNYTAFRVEDFDYRRNLNDRFLLDMMDAKKIVLKDELNVFKKDQSEPSEEVNPTVTVNVSAPNPTITTDEAIRMVQSNHS
jgi:hypothetical protein